MRRKSERLSSPAPRPFDFQKTLQRHLHSDESDEHADILHVSILMNGSILVRTLREQGVPIDNGGRDVDEPAVCVAGTVAKHLECNDLVDGVSFH